MRSPQVQAARNGETPSPSPPHQQHHHHRHNNHTPFHSTLSLQKLRRFNSLIFFFRLAAFSFSLASSVFMLTNTRRGSSSPRWYDFDAFRSVLPLHFNAKFGSLCLFPTNLRLHLNFKNQENFGREIAFSQKF